MPFLAGPTGHAGQVDRSELDHDPFLKGPGTDIYFAILYEVDRENAMFYLLQRDRDFEKALQYHLEDGRFVEFKGTLPPAEKRNGYIKAIFESYGRAD